MLREPEGQLPSILPNYCEEKRSYFPSKLFTQVTTNFESVSLDNHQDFRNDLSIRDIGFSKKMEDVTVPIMDAQKHEQDSFQSNIYEKFQELEFRSSKVLNMFPHYQSRVFNSSGSEKQGLEGGELASQMENKLKIIKDLELKIIRLESNVSNPFGSKEDILNIEKEINLDFHNYYAEAAQIIYDDLQQEERKEEELSPQEQQKIEKVEINPKSSWVKHIQSIKTSYSSYDVCILVPKLIEIEVPIPSLKIIQTNLEPQENPESNRPLQRSKSYSDKSKVSISSIGQIIKQFNRYTYQNNVPDIKISKQQENLSQGSGFHLPLDSFEKIAKSDSSEAQRQIKLRPTDRSNISSASEIDKVRDEIWNKEELEFNQEHLSLVRENEQKSQSNDCRSYEEKLEEEDIIEEENQNLKDISFFSKELQKLREELAEKTEELSKIREQSQQFEAKAVEKQIELMELTEKYEELSIHKIQQQLKLEKERKLNQESQIVMKNLNTRISSLEKQLSIVLQQKQSQTHQFLKILNDKNEQIEEYIKTNQEIKAVLTKKENIFESQYQEQESRLNHLQEEIVFYKQKMEEEGLRLNMEEANIIRDLIEKKGGLEQQELLEQYKRSVQLLKVENQELKLKNKRIYEKYHLLGAEYEVFEEKFAQLMKNYNESNLEQKQTLSTPGQSNQEESFDHEIGVINSIINYMLSQQGTIEEPSLNFIYAVSRILRRLKFCEASLDRERIERERLTNKLKGLNLSVNREIEKVEQRAERLYKENKRYKQHNQQLSSELRKSQLKLNQIKNQMANTTKLTASAHEVEKEILEMENRKICQKWKQSQNYISDLEHQLIQKKEDGQTAPETSERSTNQLSSIKVSHCILASSVVSISNRPIKALLPKKIMAPLPPIPSMATLPAQLTLDKLLHRRSWWTNDIKIKFSIKLLDLCLQLVKVSRKLFSLKPSQMVISGLEGKIEIVVRREFGNSSQEDEQSLLYRAPEVLLGFAETEASYVWSVGILLDQIWHDKLFYKKISEILSRKDNFSVRDTSLSIKDLLTRMMRKNQKERPTLQNVKEGLLTLN